MAFSSISSKLSYGWLFQSEIEISRGFRPNTSRMSLLNEKKNSLKWTPSFDLQNEALRYFLLGIWIRLPDLPIALWGTDSLSRIGSIIGVPL